MRGDIKFIFLLLAILSITLFYSIFSTPIVISADEQQLPDPVPFPTPQPAPPETYPGQVILSYTQNVLQPEESTITAEVTGTIYPLYEEDYNGDDFFTGDYLFMEGEMNWNYNAKKSHTNGYCDYSGISTGSGSIDIIHTSQILSDSKIWLESDGEYTMDINNYGRIYLTADGLPTEDTNLAQTPVQTTMHPTAGSPEYCMPEIGKEVPPGIMIRLENIQANGNILSGEETIISGQTTEKIIYTIELPSTKPDENEGVIAWFWSLIKRIFS